MNIEIANSLSVFGVFHFHRIVKELLIAWLHYTMFFMYETGIKKCLVSIGLANISFFSDRCPAST